jgi:pseudouridine-5'-phosphate glycosidase
MSPIVLEKYMVFNQEVREALEKKLPIVALESTVLSHGLPYPENLALANSLEGIVREGGCVPCTIALLEGKIHFGLTSAEIERLALAGKKGGDKPVEKIHKASVRDLGWILSTQSSGATTVAATSFLASKIGVRVFATGGIGGVHRDGHITMDVSADLVEMSRSPVVVVCAGAKSILDIGRTLEYLETFGVAVVGYRTDEFPAFFTRKSGCQVPMRLDTAESIAKLMKNSLELNVGRGVLVAVPISEKNEADAIVVERAIEKALKEAEDQKINGREITPFLLSRVSQLTGGASLKANIALLQQNASVAAQIALALSKLTNNEPSSSSNCCPSSSCSTTSSPESASTCNTSNGAYHETVQWTYSREGNAAPKLSIQRDVVRPIVCQSTGQVGCLCASSSQKLGVAPPNVVKPSKGPVFVIGGIAVDVLGTPTDSQANQEASVAGLSIPGKIALSAGGVGRNIAETLTKFGLATTLVSAVGSGSSQSGATSSSQPDFFGTYLMNDCRKKKIGLAATVISNESTAVYSALSYSNGKFRGGVAHMGVLDHVSPELVSRLKHRLAEAKLIVLDANIPVATIEYVLALAASSGIPTLFEPTSAAKVIKLAKLKELPITFIKPNVSELKALAHAINNNFNTDDIDECILTLLKAGIKHVILTMGANGVKFASLSPSGSADIKELPIEQGKVVDVNGAGDSLAAGFAFGKLSGLADLQALRLGIRAARLTTESPLSVSPLITPQLIYEFADQRSPL